MGVDEMSNYRLNQMEKDITETKKEVKDIAKEQRDQKETLITMGSDLKQNLETNKIIKNAAVGFLVVNILGLMWAFMTNIGGM